MHTPVAPRRLATTRWSLVLAAGDPSAPEARAALAALCETYWAPVYEFVKHHGFNPDQAKDVTQSFFARVLERGDLANARRERGRFRTFLLTAVRHFLLNQIDHERALKRGGNRTHVPIEPGATDASLQSSIGASAETPESIYERRWALAALDTAMSRLAREHELVGRSRWFAQLQPFIAGEPRGSYAEAATALGVTENAARVAAHRLRRQFGQALRAVLAETVDSPEDVDAELRYLIEVLARPTGASSLKYS